MSEPSIGRPPDGNSIAAVTEPRSLADRTRAVLLGIRLGAVVTADGLAASPADVGAPIDEIEDLLGKLELAGLVEHRDGRFPGWRLTSDGRAEGERLLALELDGAGVRAGVHAGYERFLALNGILLRVCTDWQLLEADPSALVVNDHEDPDHDRAVLDRLRAVHEQLEPVCAGLGQQLARFSTYEPRFADALGAVAVGDDGRFDKGALDPYHAIWFELHEHLLATLGIDRSTEPLPDAGPGAPAP
jgi:hypothetical protein